MTLQVWSENDRIKLGILALNNLLYRLYLLLMDRFV